MFGAWAGPRLSSGRDKSPKSGPQVRLIVSTGQVHGKPSGRPRPSMVLGRMRRRRLGPADGSQRSWLEPCRCYTHSEGVGRVHSGM